jgi:hypothetical protein
MYFRIERDHLDGDSSYWQGKGFATTDAPPKAERSYDVVLYCYDDDGELYYTIGCSCDGAAENAHDWARDMSGCTYSKISMTRNAKAEPFIG